RPAKSLSTEETFPYDLATLRECEEKMSDLHIQLAADLAQQTRKRTVAKVFVKLRFTDFTRTTIERAGLVPKLKHYRQLLGQAFTRTGKKVRLIRLGVRFAERESGARQLALLRLSLSPVSRCVCCSLHSASTRLSDPILYRACFPMKRSALFLFAALCLHCFA